MSTATTSVSPEMSNFGSHEPRLASMSFAELESVITKQAASVKSSLDDLVPYLQEIRSLLSFQGKRTDLRRGAPQGLTWQKWVDQKKELLGSLSTVKRLLRGDRKKHPQQKVPTLTELESRLLGTATCGHDLVKAIRQGGNVDAAVEEFLDAAPTPERIEAFIQRPVKPAPAEKLCQAAANLVHEVEASYSRPSAPQMTKKLRVAVDKLKAELSLGQSSVEVP
jgi:hypothetical protein